MNMKLLAVLTLPSNIHGCSARKTFWEEKYTDEENFTLGKFTGFLFSLQPSDVHAPPTPPPPPPLSVSHQGRGGPSPPPSAVCAHASLFSDLLTQRFKPPLQPSAVNPPPLPQLSDLPLHRYMPPLHTLAACVPIPPLSV